jgi:methylmalonyl-CoA mutase N-terminal domain/subunit
MDEVMALPTEKAVEIALRTQQIIAYETGVVNTVDPLEAPTLSSLYRHDGARRSDTSVKSTNWAALSRASKRAFQRELMESAFHYQKQLGAKKIMVGVNEFVSDQPSDMPILKIDPEVERSQVSGLQHLKETRDQRKVEQTLDALGEATKRENVMPYILDAVRVYASVQEISNAMKAKLGSYREPAFV